MQADSVGEKYDALIIGCGMAGLAAAIRLAMYGQRVLILERHNAPGGLNSFYFLAGRKFDVGLHAVTNCAMSRGRSTPMGTLLRQLRLSWDDFDLSPQAGSRIAFPGLDLRFTNDFSLLESEVERAFPGQIDGFRSLREAVRSYNALDLSAGFLSAREVVARHITDPLLADMLFCPLMYYGSATEHDMDFAQFTTLWQAIFEEGFGRPAEGVRRIIRTLLDKYRALGGQRRMRCGVKRILLDGQRAIGVELETGEILRADHILSTAGMAETEVLCGAKPSAPEIQAKVGRLSFAETISVLNAPPAEIGVRDTIVFFNDSNRFDYSAAEGPVDLRSGVICMPNNYQYASGAALPDGLVRITAIASHAWWCGQEEAAYRAAKEVWFPRIVASACRFLPGLDPSMLETRTVFRDMFTPKTIERFTAHFGGAVYGSTTKSRTGTTAYQNLYLAGTDQGFLGIVGAMLSGVSMANRHVLMARS